MKRQQSKRKLFDAADRQAEKKTRNVYVCEKPQMKSRMLSEKLIRAE